MAPARPRKNVKVLVHLNVPSAMTAQDVRDHVLYRLDPKTVEELLGAPRVLSIKGAPTDQRPARPRGPNRRNTVFAPKGTTE